MGHTAQAGAGFLGNKTSGLSLGRWLGICPAKNGEDLRQQRTICSRSESQRMICSGNCRQLSTTEHVEVGSGAGELDTREATLPSVRAGALKSDNARSQSQPCYLLLAV